MPGHGGDSRLKSCHRAHAPFGRPVSDPRARRGRLRRDSPGQPNGRRRHLDHRSSAGVAGVRLIFAHAGRPAVATASSPEVRADGAGDLLVSNWTPGSGACHAEDPVDRTFDPSVLYAEGGEYERGGFYSFGVIEVDGDTLTLSIRDKVGDVRFSMAIGPTGKTNESNRSSSRGVSPQSVRRSRASPPESVRYCNVTRNGAAPSSTASHPAHRDIELRANVVDHRDGPNRWTIYRPELPDMDRMTSWSTVDRDTFAALPVPVPSTPSRDPRAQVFRPWKDHGQPL